MVKPSDDAKLLLAEFSLDESLCQLVSLARASSEFVTLDVEDDFLLHPMATKCIVLGG